MLKYYFVINILIQLHNRGEISFNENNNQNITCVNAQLPISNLMFLLPGGIQESHSEMGGPLFKFLVFRILKL